MPPIFVQRSHTQYEVTFSYFHTLDIFAWATFQLSTSYQNEFSIKLEMWKNSNMFSKRPGLIVSCLLLISNMWLSGNYLFTSNRCAYCIACTEVISFIMAKFEVAKNIHLKTLTFFCHLTLRRCLSINSDKSYEINIARRSSNGNDFSMSSVQKKYTVVPRPTLSLCSQKT